MPSLSAAGISGLQAGEDVNFRKNLAVLYRQEGKEKEAEALEAVGNEGRAAVLEAGAP